MSRTLSKAVVFAIAVVFAAAPMVLAQATGAAPGAQPTPGMQTTPGTQERMGATGAQDTIQATVADVNHQRNTLKLRMQDGETVEFKVPEQSLANLNKGDSVQVSIRKAEGAPMGTQPARPEPGKPEPGTRSR